MTGDCHVRFSESRGVRFPPATHHGLVLPVSPSEGPPAGDLGGVLDGELEGFDRGRFRVAGVNPEAVNAVG